MKTVGSPFVETGLAAAIASLETAEPGRNIVVAGIDGSQCINNTTRHGSDLGLKMLVVSDACASCRMGEWGPEETHLAAMSMLKRYAKVITTQEMMKVLGL